MYVKFQLYPMRQKNRRKKKEPPRPHTHPAQNMLIDGLSQHCVLGVTGFAFIFEAAESWLSRIPDLNLLESGVSRSWETAQICEVRFTF